MTNRGLLSFRNAEMFWHSPTPLLSMPEMNITIDNDQSWSIEFQTRKNVLAHPTDVLNMP